MAQFETAEGLIDWAFKQDGNTVVDMIIHGMEVDPMQIRDIARTRREAEHE